MQMPRPLALAPPLLALAASLLALAVPTAPVARADSALTLPGWVTTTQPTTLWSGSDGAAVALAAAPEGRPLRAEGAAGERLLVVDPGDGLGSGGGPAWVDRSAVEAAPRPRHWYGPAEPARGVELWSGADEGAVLFGVAGPDRPLAWAGGRIGGRLLVLVADAAPGLAWASAAALAPAPPPPAGSPAEQAARSLAPEFAPPSPPAATAPAGGGSTSASAPAQPPVSAEERAAFVAEWGERARRLRGTTGIPPSLVVAMAINETGWGRSRLAREASNFFGLKATRRPGTAGALSVETWEVVNGAVVRVQQPFRAFHTPEESLLDLSRHLRESARYDGVWAYGADPDGFARAMLAAGYATDPAWADKLARLRATYVLDRFDR